MSAQLKEALKVRPNCGLPESFFQDKMVVCTGEDPAELEIAMREIFGSEIPEVHQYRCYRAWKYTLAGITVVISGIGSGALEPLLFELLDYTKLGHRAPKKLVMIGTAGYIADSGHGQVFIVEGAYPMGCAVSLPDKVLPVRPNFVGLDKLDLPSAEEMSTDYYYAATPSMDDPRKVLAKRLNPALEEAIAKYWKPGRLISMESCQFYHFCSIYSLPDTQYVALRGVANLADQFDQQGDHSQNVLTQALGKAVELLTS